MKKTIVETAAAKVNLDLFVTGKNAKDYHLLDSLVAFCDFGDELRITPSPKLSLTVTGPYATSVPKGMDNLVLKAVARIQSSFEIGKGAHIELVKNIPAAAGVGGGSADAAAAMRAVMKLWDLGKNSTRLAEIGLKLGADIPVCLKSKTRIMRGIGEQLEKVPASKKLLKNMGVLLANPGKEISTATVFNSRRSDFSNKPDRFPLHLLQDRMELIVYLKQQRNDLAPTAIQHVPEISSLLDELQNLSGHLYSQMSGSGATCIALFENQEIAAAALKELKSKNNSYWAVSSALL